MHDKLRSMQMGCAIYGILCLAGLVVGGPIGLVFAIVFGGCAVHKMNGGD